MRILALIKNNNMTKINSEDKLKIASKYNEYHQKMLDLYILDQNIQDAFDTELANYKDDEWEAPRRGARLTAAIKRYKTSCRLFELLVRLHKAAKDGKEIDVTPTIARRLAERIFLQDVRGEIKGRIGSQKSYVYIFGQAGRTAKSSSTDDDLDSFISNYCKDLENFEEIINNNVEAAREAYQKAIADQK
ncbi:hypothetical protein J4H27_22825 [Vibrio alginolyticus]|uniref:hypothetical protein n=1 Tax=Vibrio alginolyticus TaxID=663 RepID=UPI001BD39EB8|nr:hypothetical protein [Vibrio alginolyticus]MBS9944765.1 hypothetical protein [Vibrio alginolyticus]HCH1012851.1 hypothetical protein [Vibrio parahaemolyticus]HCH1833004.1 hypothetical protein [Vibrio parahaemolyticus]